LQFKNAFILICTFFILSLRVVFVPWKFHCNSKIRGTGTYDEVSADVGLKLEARFKEPAAYNKSEIITNEGKVFAICSVNRVNSNLEILIHMWPKEE